MSNLLNLIWLDKLRVRARSVLREALSDFSLTKLEPVIVSYGHLQKQRPHEPEAYLALAYVCLELDRPRQALGLVASALRLNPGDRRIQSLYRHLHSQGALD